MFLLLCLVLFFVMKPTSGAIVLQHITLDEGIRLTPMTDGVVLQTTRIPVCVLTFSIKKPGFGVIRMTHTPLFDGVRLVSYALVFEDGTPAVFQDNLIFSQEVELPCVWAELHNPLSSEGFYSTISIHLTVER